MTSYYRTMYCHLINFVTAVKSLNGPSISKKLTLNSLSAYNNETELLCDTTSDVTYRFVALLPRGCNKISLEKSECSDRRI